MTQTYNVAVWNGTHENAEPTLQSPFPLIAGFDDSGTLVQGIEAMIEVSAQNSRPCIMSVGAVYGGTQRHSAKQWRYSTALVLEWEAGQAEDVLTKLAIMQVHHIALNTTDASGRKCVAVILPLEREIDDKKDYSRLASLIASDIAHNGMSDGFHSCTFLVRPDHGGVVYESEGNLIDPDDHLLRKDFVSAKDYVGVAA